MAGTHEFEGQWERVASELRAYRESQQQAWGDIDNATLGRYLAGEVSGEEREHIERALEERPELRKLTDLVRDVLSDFEPQVAPGPVPATLPFPQTPTVRRRERPFRMRLRRYGALAAAACLLLGLGLALSRSGMFTSREAPGRMAAPGDGFAWNRRGDVSTPPRESGKRVANFAPQAAKVVVEPELLRQQIDSLERQGKREEALVVARNSVPVLNKLGVQYQREGDLAHAETFLNQAQYCSRMAFGAQHQETVQVSNNLADVYRVALNTPARDEPPHEFLGPMALTSSGREGGPYALPGAGNPYQPGVPPRGANGKDRVVYAQASYLRDRITRQNPHQVKASVLPVLVQAFQTAPTPQDRAGYALAIGELGPAARDAVPVLADCLRKKSRTPVESRAVVLALGRIGPPARRAVPALVGCLRLETPAVRDAAARALVQLGPSARPALADLDRAAKEQGDRVVREALRRLQGREGRIGVDDEGECFSVHALRTASDTITDLARKGDVEILVETTASLPADAKVRQAKVRQLGPLGVYVLIGKEGPGVEVQVTEGLRRRGFTGEKLREVLADHLRRQDYDGGLTEGVRLVANFQAKAGDKVRR